MTYVRQTSTLGGKILAILLSALFLAVTLIMTGPVMLFGFLLYGGNMIMVFGWAIRNIAKRTVAALRRTSFLNEAETPYLRVRDGIGSAYISGFIIAVPLSLLVLLASRVLAAMEEGRLLLSFVRSHAGALGTLDLGPLSIAAVVLTAVIDLGFVLWGFYHSYVAAPENVFKGTGEIEEKGVPLALLILATQFFFVTLCIAAPVGTILIGLRGIGSHWLVSGFAKAFFLLACVPAVALGAALLERGMWMRGLKSQFENLATSNVSSAAAGLVEIRGTIRHTDDSRQDQPVYSSGGPAPEKRVVAHPFHLTDADGKKVLVDLSRDGMSGPEHVLIRKGAAGRGAYREQKLMPGTEVFVIGEYAPARGEGQLPRLIPWTAPRGGTLRRAMSTFLDKALFEIGKDAEEAFPVGRIVRSALGIQFLKGIFAVTDADEKSAKLMLFNAWRRNVAIGLFYLAGSGTLLALVLAGTVRMFLVP